MSGTLTFRRDDDLPPGEVETVAPGVRRILCGNPGPFTFRGTNTYLIGRGEVTVLDPGPSDPAHLDAVLRATEGERVTRVLVSHTHRDHSPGAAALVAVTGAGTAGFGPHVTPGEGGDHGFVPDRRVADGEAVEGDGWRLVALHTPGHCANHLCFALEADPALAPPGLLFSADHVMTWSTSVVSPPDGSMADYMASLSRVLARAEAGQDRLLLPGHGPSRDDPAPYIRALLAHRQEREARVLQALRATGEAGAAALVPAVYGPSLDARLAPAAARSLLAHLVKLVGDGAASRDGDVFRAA